MLPNTNVGRIGEEFIIKMFELNGYTKIEEPENKRGDYDVKINNTKIEIKTATMDTSGNFQFNGIRYDTKYDLLIVLGIGPDAIYWHGYTKADVTTGKAGTLVPMAKGVNSSFKLTKPPSALREIEDFNEIIANYN